MSVTTRSARLVSTRLLGRAKQGQQQAIAEVLQLVTPAICSLIRFRRIHRNDWEDAVQEASMQVLVCIQRFDPRFDVEFLDYVKASISKFLIKFQYALLPGPQPSLEPGVEYQQQAAEAHDLLATLPAQQREIMEHYFGIRRAEKSVAQIASRMDSTIPKICVAIREALTTMAVKGL